MDTILITVTALSLGVTALLSVLLARLLRQERRRADARVRLLTELAGLEPAPAAQTASFTELELRPAEAASVQVASLFDEHQEPSAWPRRLAGAAAFAVIIVLATFGWSFVSVDREDAPAGIAAAPVPLELLSLTHQQEKNGLTISGLVQNPRRAGSRVNVEATALVFGADGTLLASGRAPIDVATLPAGDESPFLIRVNAAGASRYRVSFRTGDGQPLPHVDRRTQDAIARKESP